MIKEELNILGKKDFEKDPKIYKVIDFLNKALKDRKLIFGVTLKDDKHIITIYEE